MEQHQERHICTLLKRWRNTKKVAEILSEQLLESEFPIAQELTMINFIIQSGHFQLLIEPMLQRLQSNRATSWSAIVELLSRNKIRPNSRILDALFEGAQKNQMLENLILSHSWQKYDSRFQALRDELRTRLHEGILRKKDILKEKLGFLANHRMIDEEERVLQILLGMFPQDPEIQAHQVEFQERWARNVLATSHADHSFAKMHSPPPIKWSEAEIQLLKIWLAEARKLVQGNPGIANTFAILFVFVEAWESALNILELAPPSKFKDWLRLEILIQCRHFVECLREVEEIEVKYADDPEASFSAAYLRARALHGLGQNSLAVEILQSIVDVRPSYRSVQALLNEWAGDFG